VDSFSTVAYFRTVKWQRAITNESRLSNLIPIKMSA